VTVRSPAQALAYAHSQSQRGTYWGIGYCLKFVHSCFNAGARYGTASIAYSHTRYRHTSTPPAGVPVWWTGGSHGYGHVAMSAGGGYVYSTDVYRAGRVDRARISHITSAWGLHYRGWSEDINGVRVYHPGPALPVVHLANVVEASIKDPGHVGRRTHPGATKKVAVALHKEGLLSALNVNGHWGAAKTHAYAKWQRRLGYVGTDASGRPGLASLKKLGAKHGFHTLP
jgi:hypothetical protein